MSDPILEHVIEIKQRLASIETKSDAQAETLNKMGERWDGLNVRVITVETEQASGRASVKLVKWMLGIMLTCAGVVAAFVKAFKA